MALRCALSRRWLSVTSAASIASPISASDPVLIRADSFINPDIDPSSVKLPRDLIESGLPRGYLHRLGRYLKDAGLDRCNPELIAHALIHPAVVSKWSSYATLMLSWKGLAFVGDSLIYFLSASYLIQTTGDMSPSSLHCRRYSMVSNDALSRTFTSPSLALTEHLVIPKNMPARSLPSIRATAMEAFIGAVYLNQGLDTPFFAERIVPELWRHQMEQSTLDPISRFQHICQRQYRCLPEYRTLKETKVGFGLLEFNVGLFVEGRCIQQASANSVTEAKKMVALQALEKHEFAVAES